MLIIFIDTIVAPIGKSMHDNMHILIQGLVHKQSQVN